MAEATTRLNEAGAESARLDAEVLLGHVIGVDRVNLSADDAVKDGVEAALKADATLKDVKVASVNNGVVLLSGKTDAVDKELKAIETAWDVGGVRQVRSEIVSSEK